MSILALPDLVRAVADPAPAASHKVNTVHHGGDATHRRRPSPGNGLKIAVLADAAPAGGREVTEAHRVVTGGYAVLRRRPSRGSDLKIAVFPDAAPAGGCEVTVVPRGGAGGYTKRLRTMREFPRTGGVKVFVLGPSIHSSAGTARAARREAAGCDRGADGYPIHRRTARETPRTGAACPGVAA